MLLFMDIAYKSESKSTEIVLVGLCVCVYNRSYEKTSVEIEKKDSPPHNLYTFELYL
jgi:hypothetical protein